MVLGASWYVAFCSLDFPSFQKKDIQDHPHGKEMQKTKWLSGEALQTAVKRRKVKSKGEKERYKHLNAEFQIIARRDKKASLSQKYAEVDHGKGQAA